MRTKGKALRFYKGRLQQPEQRSSHSAAREMIEFLQGKRTFWFVSKPLWPTQMVEAHQQLEVKWEKPPKQEGEARPGRSYSLIFKTGIRGVFLNQSMCDGKVISQQFERK